MLQIINASQFNVRLKATIQKTGRLGFTNETAKSLGLGTDKFVKFACDDNETDTLYMVVSSHDDPNAFPVLKSGNYYYLATQLMFDSFKYNYKEGLIMFDLVRMPEHDESLQGNVYKMNKRTKSKDEEEIV